MTEGQIVIRGAREHNLKDIHLSLPRNRLVVVTGLSGSGKSSLAFDTLYAEGQRRYVESLSAYARQFLEQMDKPDVDSIEGLSPAISIEQKSSSRNPRSTVATVTEIYDHFRLLFARIGRPFCHQCGRPIERQTIPDMTAQVMRLPKGSRVMLLSPVVRGRKGEFKRELERFRREGHIRVRVDGRLVDLSEQEPALDKKLKHTLEVVVDRWTVREGIERRVSEGLEAALKLAEGVALLEGEGSPPIWFSEHFGCVHCGLSYPEISPRLFSFNNPYGACPECHGLGAKMYFDPALVVPNDALSIDQGAIQPWQSPIYRSMIRSLSKATGFSLVVPWKKLPEEARRAVLYGTQGREIEFHLESENRSHHFVREFEGVIPNLERRWRETDSAMMREELERYMAYQECPACRGKRLRPEALAVRVAGRNIIDLTGLSIAQANDFFQGLDLSERDLLIASRLLKEIRERLSFLVNVGVDYLSLSRASATLSGGESQRIRLATQIGSSLVGVLYILDEPSIGLHQRDNDRLISTLKRLRDLGNTVLVVEHDEDTILAADHVVDMGPGAGVHGGEVVAQGTPREIRQHPTSLTGRYLKGDLSIQVPIARRRPDGRRILFTNCRANNLKGFDLSLPLGMFVCVTGVSGSGKSSLVIDTVQPTLERMLLRRKKCVNCDEAQGVGFIDKVIAIDQSPIGRTPRSNPATYTGVFAPIRDLFAMLPESKARGYKTGRFSFNVKGGRCEACQGDGVLRIEMHFLPDVYVPCEQCRGRRYSAETLEVKYKGRSIADVLEMTVDTALGFFEAVPPIRNKLKTLSEVGLGYIRLGQPATTLSGGEAQRIKLSKELSRRSTGRTLYVLDEPTTGLHFDDIKRLLEVLGRLVEGGNTVVVIEHNLDVIKVADHVIDLGPEGGEGGGRIVVQGSPEDVALASHSHTGRFLRRKLGL